MNDKLKVYGAKATVYLKYKGAIQDLTEILKEKLNAPNFYLDTDQDPPYDTFAIAESLGFNLFLQKSTSVEANLYSLSLTTGHSIVEEFNDEMYDLSPWFARYITVICEIPAVVTEM